VSIDALWYRKVLGQFPTGVVIVTATDAQGGPVGMSVGSFTSVSLDPPLVAFLPARSSTSWPKIEPAGRFCINVLAGEQEALCRAFAVSGADKFRDVSWRHSPHGNPIIDGSLAWIDCTLERVDEAGDHFIVLGRVQTLEVETPSAPLIFFPGGYGRFESGPLAAGGRGDLSEPLRLADLARPELDALASELDAECVATALVGDEIVLLASAGPLEGRTSATLIGRRIPAKPPLGALWMAYEEAEQAQRWHKGDETQAARLEEIRERGHLVTPEHPLFEDRMLHAPVFGADGRVALVLNVPGSAAEGSDEFDRQLAAMLASARRLTALSGGREALGLPS
jgi:flavin reductase (DIM6/NTAB) family NADH-FMN oxidoreductase RutF/DNA-binding IclR family transcriptional regulator